MLFRPRRVLEVSFLASAVLAMAACAGGFRRFPLREPLSTDPDRKRFVPAPEEYFSPFAWDAIDNTVFRPSSEFFAFEPSHEARNVNAFDEVPDSSWFTNRLGIHEISRRELIEAACDEPPLDPSGPWTVTGGKPGGQDPGFVIKDAEGRTYLLKFDGLEQPERITSADVIGSILFWAAGYYAPCNRVVFFRPDVLRIKAGATVETPAGDKVPLEPGHLDMALQKGVRLPDGRIRAAASRYLPGMPLGPWRYHGTRDDDPNDVVPHEDRREIRAAYVLSSWIEHIDSREQNTLAMWITEDGSDRGYVRHNFLDFGDSFGRTWRVEEMEPRLGHAYFLDIPYLFEDLVTLGLIERPWHRARHGPAGRVLGYYDVRRFQPDRWRPGYPNPAFSRMTERDAAWMARILAHLDEESIRAVVAQARIRNPIVRSELTRILLGRRMRILERWMRTISPLSHPVVETTPEGSRLCLVDLAVRAGAVSASRRAYRARAWEHRSDQKTLRPTAVSLMPSPPAHVCARLPRPTEPHPEMSSTLPYFIVDVLALRGRSDSVAAPLRAHLYQLGKHYRVVGLERPYDRRPPQ